MKRARKALRPQLFAAQDRDPALGWARDRLGHDFANPDLLIEALSHTSASRHNYQRLEFLGDRVLGCVMADWLFRKHADEPEGKLARRFAELVRKEACARVARAIQTMDHIRVERAAAHARVHHTDNVLGDVCEALIGALYLDGGMDVAATFIRTGWRDQVDDGIAAPKDVKSGLQEWAQARGLPLPVYETAGRSGPDHAPLFDVRVTVKGFESVTASGSSKQEAEKRAATALFEKVTTA